MTKPYGGTGPDKYEIQDTGERVTIDKMRTNNDGEDWARVGVDNTMEVFWIPFADLCYADPTMDELNAWNERHSL